MPATIFSGNNVKALKSNLDLNGVTKILSVNADPASGAGVAAPLGSIAMDYLAGKVYKKTGSLDTEWQELGSGIGGINYIENSDAESGTAGWSTYADAAGSAPVDGTGGTANITWSRSTTSPLRGVADFNLVKDAVNRQGQGVSYDFTIDSADQAKILTISADYEVLSGTFATGDLAVYVIQDPAGTPVVLQPAGYQVTAATIGNKVRLAATFQTASNVTNYRLCIHVASVSALAYTLAFDSIAVSPQQVVYGAPVTDWQSYTPTFTGFGTASAITMYWRRAGDSIEIKGKFTSGTSTATEGRVSFPSGLTSDSGKISTIEVVGFSERAALGGVAQDVAFSYAVLSEQSVGYVTFSSRSSGTTGLTKLNGNSIASSGNVMSLYAKVPILGWSSSVVVSSSTDTRVVAGRAHLSGVQSINNGVTEKINLGTVGFDTHGCFDLTNDRYVVAVPGIYDISGAASLAAAGSGRIIAEIRVNGTTRATIRSAGNSVGNDSALVTTKESLVAGDYIELFCTNDTGASASLEAASTATYLAVSRISGPSVIAASETVAAKYYASATTTPGVNVQINFDTRVRDTHGSVTTGASWKFTAPVSGFYNVAVHTTQDSATTYGVRIYKNNSLYEILYNTTGGGATACGSMIIDLNAGDYIDARPDAAGGIRGSASFAYLSAISIHRIGN